jgi:hypothetical protein
MKTIISSFCPLLLVFMLFSSGCSKKDNGTNPNGDTEAPIISITSPQPNMPVGKTSLQVTMAATDNVGVTKVEVFIDGGASAAAVVTAQPWTANISISSLTDGNHSILAKAYDAAGNIGSSQSVLFIRGIVAIAAPVVNQTVGPAEMYVNVLVASDFNATKVDLFLDGGATPAASLSTLPFEALVPISALTDGSHTLTAKASNGTTTETSAAIPFIKGVTRMTLFEDVTSATCIPCANQNKIFHDSTNNLKTQANLAVIKYHIWLPTPFDKIWLASKQWAQPRADFLFYPLAEKDFSSPNAWISGTPVGSSAIDWIAQVRYDKTIAPEASIVLEQTGAGNQVNLTIKLKGINSSQYGDLRLHTVITESDIQYHETNSEYVHHDAMRMMLPDAGGETLTLGNGEDKSIPRSITIESGWVKANMKAIVFLQSFGSKKVLQAAKISLK